MLFPKSSKGNQNLHFLFLLILNHNSSLYLIREGSKQYLIANPTYNWYYSHEQILSKRRQIQKITKKY